MKNDGQGNDAKVAVNLGTINQTNVTGGDATKENQEELLKQFDELKLYMSSNQLEDFFGTNIEEARKNKEGINALLFKLKEQGKSVDDILKEREELLEKITTLELPKELLSSVEKAMKEMRYDDVHKIIKKAKKHSKKIIKNSYNMDYIDALAYLEQVQYFKAKDSIENIPSKKVEDPKLLNDYARIYELCGEYKEALPLYEKSLKIKQNILEEEHPSTATSYNNLAGLYESMGEYAKALPLYEKSLKIKQNILGEEHPSTATSYNNLAGLYKSMGEYAKALPLYEKSLKIKQNILEEEHPSTATSYNNLAGLYKSMGEYAKALPLYEKDLKICQNVLGEEHPSTATSYNNLAVFYYGDHDFKKSYEYMQKAVSIRKKVLPSNHPDLIGSLEGLEVIKSKL